MQKIMHGTIHGKTIELSEEAGLTEGQEVEVVVKPLNPARIGDGLRRCAGALAEDWTEEDDRILEEIYQDRKRSTRKEILE